MSPLDDAGEDADVARQALEALAAAQRRSVKAGHPQVLVQNGQLVRITAEGVEVLKTLPAKIRVTLGKKSIRP